MDWMGHKRNDETMATCTWSSASLDRSCPELVVAGMPDPDPTARVLVMLGARGKACPISEVRTSFWK
jgi:hypothetical protein